MPEKSKPTDRAAPARGPGGADAIATSEKLAWC